MKALARLILAIVHAFYTLWTLAASYVRFARKAAPHPLEYPRRQTPKHLALVLVTEDGRLKNEEEETYVCNTVADVVRWCKTVGIESLSVYNRQGVLYKYVETIREMISRPSHFESGQEDAESNSESELEFPLTPPPSDHSISRPLSRSDLRGHSNHVICMSLDGHQHGGEISGVKHRTSSRRDSFQLKLLSNDASKPLMALVARNITMNNMNHANPNTPVIDIEVVNNAIQGYDLEAPDFMIIHDSSRHNNASLELAGFPPWLVRLTEIHKTGEYLSKVAPTWSKFKQANGVTLTEADFRHALDEYASAEMRLGK